MPGVESPKPFGPVRCILLCVISILCGASLLTSFAQSTFTHIDGIVRTNDQVLISWSNADTNAPLELETTTDLLRNSWQIVTNPVSRASHSNHQSLSVNIDEPQKFFRLKFLDSSAVRGRIVSTSRIRSYSVFTLLPLLLDYGLGGLPSSGVTVYKLVYETVDPFGFPTVASAAVAFPNNRNGALPLASYQHATTLVREDVPSRLNEEANAGLFLAANGYVAVMPDYLGLGDSPRFHPYLHAKTEATASVDALRAARLFCGAQKIVLNGQLFLLGYSQGGHATVATHRELEALHTNEFTITATAAGAGPYDLSGTMTTDLLSDRMFPNPFYVAYVIAAYQGIYSLAPSLEDLLRPPYNSQLPSLLDGLHSGSSITPLLPKSPITILNPEYLSEFRTNLQHPLRLALRDNDLTRWTPKAPLRLYHCSRDEDVPPENSTVALQAFQRNGATSVALIDPFAFGDHKTCVPFALISIRQWFDSLKK